MHFFPNLAWSTEAFFSLKVSSNRESSCRAIKLARNFAQYGIKQILIKVKTLFNQSQKHCCHNNLIDLSRHLVWREKDTARKLILVSFSAPKYVFLKYYSLLLLLQD